MGKKNLHIVCGVQARGTLMMSEVHNPKEMELVCLEDILSIGPIVNLGTKEGQDNRINWLTQMEPAFAGQIAAMVHADIVLIDTIKHNIDQYNSVYLWIGSDVNEILAGSRLLYCLETIFSSSIFRIDFLNTGVTRRIGDFIYPKSLSETAINQVGALYESFKPLKKQALQKMRLIWEKLSNDDAHLRIAIEDAHISGSEIDFYDSSLLKHCTRRSQAAIGIVGKTLGDMNGKNIREGIVDSFLNWRLKQLAQNGKLKYRGILSSMRDYKVKLA